MKKIIFNSVLSVRVRKDSCGQLLLGHLRNWYRGEDRKLNLLLLEAERLQIGFELRVRQTLMTWNIKWLLSVRYLRQPEQKWSQIIGGED